MAEPIDYLKTYLNIDPMDYSAMEAQIAGEPLPEREVFTMPSYRPQVDLSQMEAMPMQPMSPTHQIATEDETEKCTRQKRSRDPDESDAPE
mgnify:CR=1 FL=1